MPFALRTYARGAPARWARGGAMVEFVLLNLILIPLLLYAIFLMDAAYLKLDLQETVVSGVWDFSQRNTEPPSFKGVGDLDAPVKKADNDAAELATAAKGVRQVFADHTSAFDDGADPDQTEGYNIESYLRGSGNGDPYPSPKGHKKHHTGFGAQYSFRFEKTDDTDEEVDLPDDTQFNCFIADDMGWNPEPNMNGFGKSGYNTGGEARCKATGYIYNYIIPEKFLQEFSQVELTKMKQRKDTTGKGAHEWQGTGGDLANIVAYETASISFNTWALRNGAKTKDDPKDINRYKTDVGDADLRVPQTGVPLPTMDEGSPEANPFFRRVQYLYTMNGTAGLTYGKLSTAAGDFTSKAMSNNIMAVETLPPGTVTNALLPNVVGVFLTARYQKGQPDKNEQDAPGSGKGKFQSTPYSGINNDYQSVGKKRGHFYLGCKSPGKTDCF